MELIRNNPLLLAPVILLQIGLQAGALIELAHRDRVMVRGGKKWPWVLVIIFLNLLGPIVYLTMGRKED